MPPTEYNAHIADNGDVIFAFKSELRKYESLPRTDTIVYKYPDYTATKVEVTGGVTGWLQNSGVVNSLDGNSFLFGEYTRMNNQFMNVWKVSEPYTNPSDWVKVLTIERSHTGEEGLKHIHTVTIDPYTGFIYAATGDDEDYSRFYISKNNGDTFTLLQEGPEKHLRVLNLIFTPDYAYWGTDGGKPNYHIFVKCGRDVEGVLDLPNIEEVFMFPNQSVRFSTYSTCLIREPYGILFLNRLDANTRQDLPVFFYSLEDKKMHLIKTFKSAYDGAIQYGFRNEAVTYYQPYADDRVCCGFVNYPNNLDILGNKGSAVDSIIGIASDYLTNENKINNLTLKVVYK